MIPVKYLALIYYNAYLIYVCNPVNDSIPYMIKRCTFHILSQTFNVFPISVAGMPPLTTHAIELLYTPQDYDNKLLFQTWQHLIRADYRTFLESCDDPAPLPTNPKNPKWQVDNILIL